VTGWKQRSSCEKSGRPMVWLELGPPTLQITGRFSLYAPAMAFSTPTVKVTAHAAYPALSSLQHPTNQQRQVEVAGHVAHADLHQTTSKVTAQRRVAHRATTGGCRHHRACQRSCIARGRPQPVHGPNARLPISLSGPAAPYGEGRASDPWMEQGCLPSPAIYIYIYIYYSEYVRLPPLDQRRET
jgi:hypothetical protein